MPDLTTDKAMRAMVKSLGGVLREVFVRRDARIVELEQRIAELEARPTIAEMWQGLWSSERSYARGQVVSWDGSAWTCTSAISRGENPSKQADDVRLRSWRLLVQKGKAGRDGKDLR